jgi:drug/metabolite transporter (DMT)-like permease
MLHVSAQRVIGPSRTAIVLSAEPVFAAATAAVVLGERLTVRGWLGAVLIMAGVYIVLAFSPPEQADFVVAKQRDRGSLTGAEPTYQPVADGDAAERGE